ncbi:hypothetical protein [Stutzerimonas azotifigens]|uniref:hypothetical protein n=1 Tax=Stutzerimonas azotifigens TaxID=291995 RepID=UPI0004246FB3|nr:hypothetical protein [Stutzerimonas azotifigens]
MADDNILSSEELEFINSLMAGNGRSPTSTTPNYLMDGGPQANELLLRMANHAELALQAQFDTYSLSFPLQLTEDDFHNLHLTLAAPVIYERGPVLRAWRLPLDKPLPLLDADGARSSLSVHELSPSGVLVRSTQRRRPPEAFNLMLALPDGDAMPVEGHRVRDLDSGLSAYEVDFDERDAERVRRFLFRQHRRLHPELVAETSDDMV